MHKHIMLPLYTMKQVSLHNKKDDAWIVIRGVVIDVTKYAKKHPGGKRILYKHAGKDVTSLFEKHHKEGRIRDKAYEQMQQYIIGHVRADIPFC